MILTHAVSDGQAYHVSMNEDTVNLGYQLRGIDVSIPGGDSAYLDLFYGGTFTDGSPVATGLYLPAFIGAQPPMVFASTVSGSMPFLRYYLGGWINLFGDLEAVG